jgi:hypothetical protein
MIQKMAFNRSNRRAIAAMLMLVLIVAFAPFLSGSGDSHALSSAAGTPADPPADIVNIVVVTSPSSVATVAAWTWNKDDETYYDGGTELSIISTLSDFTADGYVRYPDFEGIFSTGSNAVGPRFAIVNTGILLDDLCAYAGNLAGVTITPTAVKVTVGAGTASELISDYAQATRYEYDSFIVDPSGFSDPTPHAVPVVFGIRQYMEDKSITFPTWDDAVKYINGVVDNIGTDKALRNYQGQLSGDTFPLNQNLGFMSIQNIDRIVLDISQSV